MKKGTIISKYYEIEKEKYKSRYCTNGLPEEDKALQTINIKRISIDYFKILPPQNWYFGS